MTIVGHIYASHPSTRFKVGDLVSIDWRCDGQVTTHRITDKRTGVQGSQTGVMFCVAPHVQCGVDFIDAAWVWADGLEIDFGS